MTIETILKEVPLFSLLPTEVLPDLVKSGQMLSFTSNQIVCREGDVTDAMYVVLDGQLRVYKRDDEGNEVDIAAFKSGDFFGEMAMFDNQPRSATVMCLKPCHLFMLDKEAFMNLLLHPGAQGVSFSILAALVRRVRAISEKFFDEELNKRLLQAEMEAERHRSIAQMVAGVAHELNTPLGIVNTAVDMIATRVQSDTLAIPLIDEEKAQTLLSEMEEATHLASRNISRAHKLVQQFKKISVSQLTDTRESVILPRLIDDILELFKLNARRASLKIEVNDSLPEEHKIWSGYPGLLTQVLTNILFNIERHAYPDQSGGTVKVGLTQDSAREPAIFVLTVQDFGQGIAPDHLPQLFTPFFTTSRSRGGTGLGLAIVHNIVTEALKGNIKVESAPNEGCTVKVIFPQQIPVKSTGYSAALPD